MTNQPRLKQKIFTPLHWIACFEAFKGIVVLLAGFGLITLLHADVQRLAHDLIDTLHLNPARHLTSVFLKLADDVTSLRLMQFAGLAFLYSTVRLVEAYGLWHDRRWAEWFAALAGGIYLPIELYELWIQVTPVKLAVFILNLVTVIYLAYNLHKKRKPIN